MHKRYILSTIGLTVALLGLLFSTLIPAVEAFDWDSMWKPTKYERWNCCPGFNPNINFKSIPTQETISSNEIIQNLEINQICENVEICLIDLNHLNSQINYNDR
jgi:hypothetical protein